MRTSRTLDGLLKNTVLGHFLQAVQSTPYGYNVIKDDRAMTVKCPCGVTFLFTSRSEVLQSTFTSRRILF